MIEQSTFPKHEINSSFLQKASVVEIADFYNKTVEAEHLRNPDLGSYGLLKIAASDLPEKVSDDIALKALEAMGDKDDAMRLAGKRAFQFLSLRTILAVVDSSLDEEEQSGGNREDMLNSAMIYVVKKAPKIDQKSEIHSQVNNLAQQGVLSYLCEKNEIPLDINSQFAGEGISLVKMIMELRSKSLTGKEMKDFAKEWHKKTGVFVDDLCSILRIEQATSMEMKGDKNLMANEAYRKVETEELKAGVVNVLHSLLLKRQNYREERRSRRQIRVIEGLFGLDDGKEKTKKEVGREFWVCEETIRTAEQQAFRKLRHPMRLKKLKNLL